MIVGLVDISKMIEEGQFSDADDADAQSQTKHCVTDADEQSKARDHDEVIVVLMLNYAYWPFDVLFNSLIYPGAYIRYVNSEHQVFWHCITHFVM